MPKNFSTRIYLRTEHTHSRVAELETKLENLIAHVGHVNSMEDSHASPLQFPTPQSQREDVTVPMHQPTIRLSTSQHPAPAASLNSDLSTLDPDNMTLETLIASGTLTTDIILCYLSQFHEMCSYFPFVIVPSGATIGSLLQSRPFLLHAVLAVASSSSVQLQSVLEKSFRLALLRRNMLEGEKSMDLLQGLLVYLAW